TARAPPMRELVPRLAVSVPAVCNCSSCFCPPDCSCVWTDWIDVSYPNSSDRNSGDYETFESIQKNVPSWSCMKAENISCRAQKFPDVPIENLGQNVECSVTIGLICNNRDQNIGGITPMPVCLNYEISVCCIPNIPACTTTAPSSSTTSTISLPPKSTTTPVPTPSGLPSSTATTTTPPSSTTSSTLGTTTFPGTPAPTPT
ncbi:MUC5A protein, partial [Rhynochetos jubatus]|nr:MUC5A protein [Rhynochetos jubatus]